MTQQISSRAPMVVVERESREGVYGIPCARMIVDHPRHGRLLLVEGYGGEDTPAGGTYRWRHGIAAALCDDDTLASLNAHCTDQATILECLLAGYRAGGREPLRWSGHAIEALARKCS